MRQHRVQLSAIPLAPIAGQHNHRAQNPQRQGRRHTVRFANLDFIRRTIDAAGRGSLGPYFLGLAGVIYLGVALLLSVAFTGFALAVWRDPTERLPKRMFAFSILYLFLLFALLIVDRAPMALQG